MKIYLDDKIMSQIANMSREGAIKELESIIFLIESGYVVNHTIFNLTEMKDKLNGMINERTNQKENSN